MKIKTTLSVLGILSVISFGAVAADSINLDQAANRQPLGTVSVGAIGSSPMDMRAMLAQKAQDQGATSYRIIEAHTGSSWHATAEL